MEKPGAVCGGVCPTVRERGAREELPRTTTQLKAEGEGLSIIACVVCRLLAPSQPWRSTLIASKVGILTEGRVLKNHGALLGSQLRRPCHFRKALIAGRDSWAFLPILMTSSSCEGSCGEACVQKNLDGTLRDVQ